MQDTPDTTSYQPTQEAQDNLKGQNVPVALRQRYSDITELTDGFCAQHLTEEYRDLCRTMTAALSRKRPSPLVNGPIKSWACTIIYMIGKVNYLFNKDSKPYMRADQLCRHFDLQAKTISARATRLSAMLGITALDPDWMLPSLAGENPRNWYIMVDGLMIDARHTTRDVQERAFALGAIPYIPDESGDLGPK
jgi:hypothetical protein